MHARRTVSTALLEVFFSCRLVLDPGCRAVCLPAYNQVELLRKVTQYAAPFYQVTAFIR